MTEDIVAPERALTDEEREALIIDHVPLLKHIVGRMVLDVPGSMERDDLFGFGMLGLIAAADSWDNSRGIAFSTFAYPRIRGAILDELRRMDFLPRGRRERVRQVDAAIAELEQVEGTRPTPERIAEHLGWTADEVDEALSSASAAVRTSIDAPADEEGSGGLASMLLDPSSKDPPAAPSTTSSRKCSST